MDTKSKKGESRLFGTLQRIGRAFMLPIALLPIAGLFLGIGSSFTNATMLATYNLDGIIHPGTALYTLLSLMKACGEVVFDNLALLFAIGVAIGLAKKEKEVAALSGAIGYLIMNVTISVMIALKGGVEAMAANTTTTSLGITTLQMGVFGGILVGIGVAVLHNRFHRIQLPQVISFFGGSRFVPIITTAVFLPVGVILFYVWPFIQSGIASASSLVVGSGYIGTLVYGIIERALIPFGLHHVFYIPFWQTGLGGTAIIDGELIKGAQNIFFAELASPATKMFSVSATRFMAGKFPFMIFGLPGAALAMYKTALPEKRKIAGGLLLSAALTSMLTGITEPLEFTFLFVAPVMYAVHCIFAGLSFMLMHMLNVGVGMTFSGGLIDLFLFGTLQGNAKTNWIWVIVVGIVYFILYYFMFSIMIRKGNLKTPGRDEDENEIKLFTRSDYNNRKRNTAGGGSSADTDPVSEMIVKGLGGKNNISDLDCCATRLRVTVLKPELVNEKYLKQSGAAGVLCKGDGVQVVYGPQVTAIKGNLEDYLACISEDADADAAGTGEEAVSAETDAADIGEAAVNPEMAADPISGERIKSETIAAPVSGKIINLEDVPDEAFSAGIMGRGVAIEPEEGKLYSPADGTIQSAFPTGHAVAMTTRDGAELLIHIGIDTVKLNGRYFEMHVTDGQSVKRGDILVSFDADAIRKAGYDLVTPVVVCNTDEYGSVEILQKDNVKTGFDLLALSEKS